MDQRTSIGHWSTVFVGSELPAAESEKQERSEFARAVLAGLQQDPKRISTKYLYDAAGSALFDRICAVPEYYPTRVETAILAGCVHEVAALAGPRAEIVEFGAGSMSKVRLLLDAFASAEQPVRYVPIDVSGSHLSDAVQSLRQAYPRLTVQPVVADYTMPLLLPARWPADGRRIGFFPGSTIGNFEPDEAQAFLRRAGHLLRGGGLLVGVDLIKHPAILHAAYNDSQGVTAAFNLNLLHRFVRELRSDIDPSRFVHHALYVPRLRRVEMHLVSLCDQVVHVAGQAFRFGEGESIHTESSHKFSVGSFRALAVEAGFRPGPVWLDAARLFSVHWLHAPLER